MLAGDQSRPRARVTLGVTPDYSAHGEGLKLEAVAKDSAAEKAGLKAGDSIVELAGSKIKSIEDLMGVMTKLKPDEAVKISIKRGSETKVLDIKPQAPPARNSKKKD
jgi:S1-C subfamily serine protease